MLNLSSFFIPPADSEQTETFTETSRLSTGPLASTHLVATTEAGSSTSSSRNWRDNYSTGQTSDSSSPVSWEASSWMSNQKVTPPQESPETTRLGEDTSSSSSSQTSADTNGTFTFTTISRAGERTLLSVTSSADNSTSSAFTEDSKPHRSRSAWVVSSATTETEDYTRRTDVGELTDQHTTRPFGSSSGTQTLTVEPNATQRQPFATSQQTSSDSTPPFRVTPPSTHLPAQVSVSSAPPIVSPTVATVTGTPEQESSPAVETSTEASTGVKDFSTQNRLATDVFQAGEQSTALVLTTGPPPVSSSTSPELYSWRTLTATAEMTEVTTTATTDTPVTFTHRCLFVQSCAVFMK